MYGLKDNDPECLKTVEEAVAYIEKTGFLPLFKNQIPGFSLEEHTSPGHWWSGDARDPWEWREIISRDPRVAYGKFFDKKSGFISKEWFPVFANYRRDGYDFDALWDDEKAARRQKKIMDLFLPEETKLYSYEIKKEAGFGKDGEKNFDGTICGLQMMTYLIMCDFAKKKNKKGQSYGMDVALFEKPEEKFGYDHVSSCYKEDPLASFEKIAGRMRTLYPGVTEAQIRKILKP